MARRLIVAPAVEPVSMSELKAHLRIDHGEEDDVLLATLVVARATVERLSQRALITQTVRLFLDEAPQNGLLRIQVSPVQRIAAARVWTATEVSATLPASGYRLDAVSEPARLLFTDPIPIPHTPIAGIEVDVVIGYGDTGAAVPASLRQAVKLLAAAWYENRGDGPEAAEIPAAVRALTDDFRPRRLVA